eukprot:TRINITY_DN5804_c0_g1_i1.p1 TRINITY_DN5804_c0_g1~~TRINITY_DN5804_c0_g1_i1.p1  ORF type:complete len:62 (+),score=5.49 TRINITY_DN5804_c0_g1_i1:45-230(+)
MSQSMFLSQQCLDIEKVTSTRYVTFSHFYEIRTHMRKSAAILQKVLKTFIFQSISDIWCMY